MFKTKEILFGGVNPGLFAAEKSRYAGQRVPGNLRRVEYHQQLPQSTLEDMVRAYPAIGVAFLVFLTAGSFGGMVLTNPQIAYAAGGETDLTSLPMAEHAIRYSQTATAAAKPAGRLGETRNGEDPCFHPSERNFGEEFGLRHWMAVWYIIENPYLVSGLAVVGAGPFQNPKAGRGEDEAVPFDPAENPHDCAWNIVGISLENGEPKEIVVGQLGEANLLPVGLPDLANFTKVKYGSRNAVLTGSGEIRDGVLRVQIKYTVNKKERKIMVTPQSLKFGKMPPAFTGRLPVYTPPPTPTPPPPKFW